MTRAGLCQAFGKAACSAISTMSPKLLWRSDEGRATVELVAQVAEKIRKKIGWRDDDEALADQQFLREFYAAQRAHLEHKLLFGERKERKAD